MKSKIAGTALAALFAFGLMLMVTSPSYADDDGCSLAHAAGKYGFTDNGTVLNVGLRTAVGVFTLDGAGNLINGSATSSLAGNIAIETFSGTYTVNSDCTATFTAKIYSGGVEILDLAMNGAFDDHMKEIRGLFTSVTTPNGTVLTTVISLEAKRQ